MQITIMKLRSLSSAIAVGSSLIVAARCEASRFGIARKGHLNLGDASTAKHYLPNLKSSWAAVPRGGSESAPISSNGADPPGSVGDMVVSAVKGLTSYMEGPKADTLLLLLTTALNTPLCKMVGTSPILGFLALGVLFGPNGFSLIKDIHTTESK